MKTPFLPEHCRKLSRCATAMATWPSMAMGSFSPLSIVRQYLGNSRIPARGRCPSAAALARRWALTQSAGETPS
eukprot:14566451-Alexandrium_andersonii.AAC.1